MCCTLAPLSSLPHRRPLRSGYPSTLQTKNTGANASMYCRNVSVCSRNVSVHCRNVSSLLHLRPLPCGCSEPRTKDAGTNASVRCCKSCCCCFCCCYY